MRLIKLPPKQEQVLDAVSEADRKYFEAHPDAGSYLRPFIAGEIAPLPDPDRLHLVEVTQIAPGFRTRQLMPVPDVSRN